METVTGRPMSCPARGKETGLCHLVEKRGQEKLTLTRAPCRMKKKRRVLSYWGGESWGKSDHRETKFEPESRLPSKREGRLRPTT